ncbi:MAG: YggU family protein [Candidatus Omnitrophica bacterium]|nr:YggU family protein [Candidatus Omnitrophota bacterium]
MIINIKVTPGAKKNLLKDENGQLKLHLTAPAVEGKANKAVIDFLADYYDVRKTNIEIIKGLKSRNKTININEIKNGM